ncbi:hypothetical protein SAMN02745165_02037 [Malonomonas rubra DSM 5091]|uniref:DUF5666 domain-containing protein n=1 Tax=Malonomonas rubra DSM 5091 TaxID=1122189 RepID=A0A1M6I6S4_MALRU|nr:DUF5666 domain-containing protein [Malonomonas rubra]SHJ30157.1 hypothetical protein SAMN02745165_02037 [Malonomonas rubra DSM 5091]
MLKRIALFTTLFILMTMHTAFASGYGYKSGEQKIYGVVEQIPQDGYGHWIIDGHPVLVTERTKIENEYGRIAVGSYVEVEGVVDNQGFRAYEIEGKAKNDSKRNEYGNKYRQTRGSDREEYGSNYAEGNEFYGVVEQIPTGGLGTWRISGREVFVDRSTRIKSEHGPITVGAKVEVSGAKLADNGAFYAHEIETE